MEDSGPLAITDDREGFPASKTEKIDGLREYTRTGRPYGDRVFIAPVERTTGRVLGKKRLGRRPRCKK